MHRCMSPVHNVGGALITKPCDDDLVFVDIVQEKMTLGVLRSEIARRLQKDKVLIFDSLNLIKGYRYEVWCLARGSSTRCCVVHVDTPVDTCRNWNESRSDGVYTEETFEDLASRLERPDSKNRWEAPLYSVFPLVGQDSMRRVCEAIAQYNTNAKPSISKGMGDKQQQEVEVQEAQGMKLNGKDLQPTIATSSQGLSSTNLLHDVDKELQAVVKEIMEAQTLAGGSAAGIIKFGPDMPILHATRPLSVVELRRYKRMFLKLATNNTFERTFTNASQVRPLFVTYVSQQVHGLS